MSSKDKITLHNMNGDQYRMCATFDANTGELLEIFQYAKYSNRFNEVYIRGFLDCARRFDNRISNRSYNVHELNDKFNLINKKPRNIKEDCVFEINE